MADDTVPLGTPLPCWHESLASARTDPLVALSVDGAVIATDRPLPPGMPVFLEVTLGETRAQIDAVAVGASGNGVRGFAVDFLSLDDTTRTWIEARLEAERPTPVTPVLPALPAVPDEPFAVLPRTRSGGDADVREETQRFVRAPGSLGDTPRPPGPAEGRSKTSPLMPGLEDEPRPPPLEPEVTAPFAQAPPRVKTQVMGATPESTPPMSLDDAPARASFSPADETQPWTRAPGARTSTPLSTPVLPLSSSPSSPLPRITSLPASLDMAQPPLLAVEETQRWPTARVRVTAAPLELPVGEVTFSPPDVDEHAVLAESSGLDALFSDVVAGDVTSGAAGEGLQAPPALSFDPAPGRSDPFHVQLVDAPSPLAALLDDTQPLPPAPDEDTAPLPISPGWGGVPFVEPASPLRDDSLFGSVGGMLGDDDAIPVGGSGIDFAGTEVTDPGARHTRTTMEEARFDSLDNRQELIVTAEDEPLEMVLDIESLDDEPRALPLSDTAPHDALAGDSTAPKPASFDPFASTLKSSPANPFAPSPTSDPDFPAEGELPSPVMPPALPPGVVGLPRTSSSGSLPRTASSVKNPFAPPTSPNPFVPAAATPSPDLPAPLVNPFAPAQPDPFASADSWDALASVALPDSPSSSWSDSLDEPESSPPRNEPPRNEPPRSEPPRIEPPVTAPPPLPSRAKAAPTAPFTTLAAREPPELPESPRTPTPRPAPLPTTRTETEPYLSLKGLRDMTVPQPSPFASLSSPPSPFASLSSSPPPPSPLGSSLPFTPDEPVFPVESLSREPMPQAALFSPSVETLPESALSPVASMLGNDATATVPPQEILAALGEGETFFDEGAFGAVDSSPAASSNAADVAGWSVQVPEAHRVAGPPEEDDLPLVLGNDLPVITGRAVTSSQPGVGVGGAPLPEDPLAWIVGEPAKK